MKYLISLLAGIVSGAALFVTALYFNPFSASQSISPLAVSSEQQLSLNFTGVPSESVLYTNSGESTASPYPEKTAELWESTVRRSRIAVVELGNGRGEPVGVGIKFSSDSEDTQVLNSLAIVDSVWHIYIPGRGTLFVDQRENYWSYLRDVVIQARWNSADNWRGAWNRVMTSGPNAIGTARVRGGSGEFAGVESEAVESLKATAYSVSDGPVAMDGSLAITLPDTRSPQTAQQN